MTLLTQAFKALRKSQYPIPCDSMIPHFQSINKYQPEPLFIEILDQFFMT